MVVVKHKEISTLGFALLGLIETQPSTGYELRRVFRETPMGRYSSSPGAIYPALHTLESQKHIRARHGVGRTGRCTQTWHVTAAGRKRLTRWLQQDVTVDELFQAPDVVLLRFSYLDLLDDLDWSEQFLRQFHDAACACSQRVATIRESLKSVQPPHGQLALASGEQAFVAHATWAKWALVNIRERQEQRTR